MAGYTRADVTDQIANGNTVDAVPLDGEFDAIQGAFAAVGGHRHNGSVGEGAPITVIGPTQDVVASANSLTPKTDNAIDLGSSSFEWKDLYVDGTANIDSLVADTVDINGGTIDGTVIGGTTPAAITATSATVGGDTVTTNTAAQTLTNKTINLANNTLVATSAQLAASVSDETGSGALVFATSPALSGVPTAPTAVADTNTTQIATTAHVFAERSNTATLTNKTLTSPIINTPTITGGSVSGITDLAIADGGTGASDAPTALINLGLTATAAELNTLDGVTASTAEINLLDGVTYTLTNLNSLTASVSELNVLDGITGIASEAEALAGTDNTKLMTALRVAQAARPVFGTAVNSTSGTSINFTSIPSWARKITVTFDGVSTNGTAILLLQLGDSGGVETTGYIAGAGVGTALSEFATSTSGFPLSVSANSSASEARYGAVVLTNYSGNSWVLQGSLHAATYGVGNFCSGAKQLSSTLDRIRITTVGGTNTFDGGVINIAWE